jgi:hypothetical protein
MQFWSMIGFTSCEKLTASSRAHPANTIINATGSAAVSIRLPADSVLIIGFSPRS